MPVAFDYRILKMERKCLRYFVVVAEELSFGKAAQLLYFSWPALSKQAASGNRSKPGIGSRGLIAPEFLPEMPKLLGGMYPAVEVPFFEISPAKQIDAPTNGRIDIGFTQSRRDLNVTSPRCLSVAHSYLRVAVSSRHALATRERVTPQWTTAA